MAILHRDFLGQYMMNKQDFLNFFLFFQFENSHGLAFSRTLPPSPRRIPRSAPLKYSGSFCMKRLFINCIIHRVIHPGALDRNTDRLQSVIQVLLGDASVGMLLQVVLK